MKILKRAAVVAMISALAGGAALAAPSRPPNTTDTQRLRAWHKESLGQDWLYVGSTSSGVWSVRFGSVSWQGYPIVEADVRLDKPTGEVLWRQAHERYDCERFRTQVLRLDTHYGGAKPDTSAASPSDWVAMEEGTAGRRILDVVCEAARRGLKKEDGPPADAPRAPARETDKS